MMSLNSINVVILISTTDQYSFTRGKQPCIKKTP